MATLTLTSAARSAAADAVVDLLDAGTANATGDIDFQTSGGSSLCVCNLSSTAFGAASAGVATANAVSTGTVSTGGTIAKAVFRNKDNTDVFQCDVTATGGGGSIILSGVVVNADDTISITALTYTQPAS